MTIVQQTSDLRHLLYPKCPYNDSVVVLVSRLGVLALGSIGISFLNVWVAVVYLVYSVVFNLLVWPIIHCQYCYYKVKETTVDKEDGKTVQNLLPLDEWKETFLPKHVECGKRWGSPNLMILWLGPIILMILSLIISFSIFALLSLLGFIGVLAINLIYIRQKVCPTCAFMEECHAAF
jgi:membrane protein YdbS with pleckstrin-like domain